MRRFAAPLVVVRVPDGLLVGHVAMGNAVAGLVQARGVGEGQSWTAAVPGGGEAVHGGNGAGLVCAALEGGGHPAVRAVLERADGVAAAVEVLRGAVGGDRLPVRLLLADSTRALVAEVGGGPELECHELRADELGAGSTPIQALRSVIAALRAREPAPRHGHVPLGGLVALLSDAEPPRLHLALGPPSCAVFIAHWPGMELVPTEQAGPQGAVLARLAAAVAETTATDPELRQAARLRLDEAEAEALREGEDAERMAALMDEHGDDRGAAVRRLVAQAHAAELARGALEELAVPPRT